MNYTVKRNSCKNCIWLNSGWLDISEIIITILSLIISNPILTLVVSIISIVIAIWRIVDKRTKNYKSDKPIGN